MPAWFARNENSGSLWAMKRILGFEFDAGKRRAWRGLRARAALGLALAAFVGAAAALAPELLQPQVLHYRVFRGDTLLGDGHVQLKPAGTPNCFFYEQEAFPRSWLRWLSGDILEQSHFCVHDNAIRPVAFRYNRSGVGAAKENFSLRFDWARHEAVNQNGEVRPIEDGMVDRLSMQLVLRDWMLTEKARTGKEPENEREVPFPDRKRNERYRFQIRARETVETPAGRFETVRLDRTDSTKRRTQFWLSPQHAYIVIKAEQQRGDDPVLRLLLSKAP